MGTSTGSLQEEIAQLNQLNQEMKDEVTGLRRTLSQIQEEKMILQEKVLTLSEEQKRREEELLEIYVAIAQVRDSLLIIRFQYFREQMTLVFLPRVTVTYSLFDVPSHNEEECLVIIS